MIQHTYILDTNVYGELLTELEREVLVKKIRTDKTAIIYGVEFKEGYLK